MSETVIKIENLSKQYRLGVISHGTLRRDLQSWWARLHGNADPNARYGLIDRAQASTFVAEELDKFWALKDVTFDVARGEVLGVIGSNGAGKSTLLKILSRVTTPSSGQVKIRGRVASLLEVGTGFHPELTGRENIFLNGAILGMNKNEIRSKLEEIVDFSGVERFIDTPVKRYSSGMAVRLAFAVAAHLEPEILIVDEVLAVGDAEFQKKCIGKMQDVAGHGRTVLFVSHNMAAIAKLCKTVLVLKKGEIAFHGGVDSGIAFYHGEGTLIPPQANWATPEEAPGDDRARLKSIKFLDEQGRISERTDIRRPASVEIEYWDLVEDGLPTAILHFKDSANNTLFATNEFNSKAWKEIHTKSGLVSARCNLPGNFFAEGRFTVLVALGTYSPNMLHVVIDNIISFEVIDNSDGDGVRGPVGGDWPGLLRPWINWDTKLLYT